MKKAFAPWYVPERTTLLLIGCTARIWSPGAKAASVPVVTGDPSTSTTAMTVIENSRAV